MYMLDSFPVSGYFCLLLTTFANSLDPDLARQNVGPDLDPNRLTLWWYSQKKFLKRLILTKNQPMTTKRMQIVKHPFLCWTHVSGNFFIYWSPDPNKTQGNVRAQKKVRPDLDSNHLTLWLYSPKKFLLKRLILKKISRQQKKHANSLTHFFMYVSSKGPLVATFSSIDRLTQIRPNKMSGLIWIQTV